MKPPIPSPNKPPFPAIDQLIDSIARRVGYISKPKGKTISASDIDKRIYENLHPRLASKDFDL